MWELYVRQNGRCALTGIPIYFRPRGGSRRSKSASCDRIDSNIGYCINNIQWVHKDINMMKFKYPLERFLYLCSSITANNPKPDNLESLLLPYKIPVINGRRISHLSREYDPGSSKYRGVSWHKKSGKWAANICFNRNQIDLGLFDCEVTAAANYDYYAKLIFGDGCHLNGVDIPEDFKPHRDLDYVALREQYLKYITEF